MSGGSYDYASYEMENGEIGKASRLIDTAIRDMAEHLQKPAVAYDYTEREVDGRKYRGATSRPATEAERLLTEMALGALSVRLAKFKGMIEAAVNAAQDLAPLFHELEWRASGDTGDESFQDWAREWANKQLEST